MTYNYFFLFYNHIYVYNNCEKHFLIGIIVPTDKLFIGLGSLTAFIFWTDLCVLKWIRKEIGSRDDKKFVQSVKWIVSRSDRNVDILSGYTGCEIKIWYRYADWFALTFFSRCLLPATGWPRYEILKNKIDPFNGTVVSVRT